EYGPAVRIGIQGTTSYFTVGFTESLYAIARRGSSTLEISAAPSFIQNTKAYIEVHLTPTTYEVLVDGNVTLSGSMTSIGSFQSFLFRGVAISGTGIACYVDDIYVNDASGDINNGYLGEIS